MTHKTIVICSRECSIKYLTLSIRVFDCQIHWFCLLKQNATFRWHAWTSVKIGPLSAGTNGVVARLHVWFWKSDLPLLWLIGDCRFSSCIIFRQPRKRWPAILVQCLTFEKGRRILLDILLFLLLLVLCVFLCSSSSSSSLPLVCWFLSLKTMQNVSLCW